MKWVLIYFTCALVVMAVTAFVRGLLARDRAFTAKDDFIALWMIATAWPLSLFVLFTIGLPTLFGLLGQNSVQWFQRRRELRQARRDAKQAVFANTLESIRAQSLTDTRAKARRRKMEVK